MAQALEDHVCITWTAHRFQWELCNALLLLWWCCREMEHLLPSSSTNGGPSRGTACFKENISGPFTPSKVCGSIIKCTENILKG